MPAFTKKPLTATERVCLRLKQARESAGMTLDSIVEKTKINKTYLAALEECRFAELKFAPLYQKNFVRKYVEALGLDPEPYVSQFYIEELDLADRANYHPKPAPRLSLFNNLPGLVRYGLIALASLGLIIYLGLQVKHTLTPPSLVLSSPMNGYIAQKNSIVISGATEPEVKVSINGAAIRSDERGHFSESVTLNPGLNAITVTAEKKHGQTTAETRHVIFKATERFSLSSPPPDEG